MGRQRRSSKASAREPSDASKRKLPTESVSRAAPMWFEPRHRAYEGDDPWFVVRFVEAPSALQAKGLRERFVLSALSNYGSAELDGRDLYLDFTETALEQEYPGGYAAFVAKFEQWVAELHLFCPALMIFFQPGDDQLAMDDEPLLELHRTPQTAVADLAEGPQSSRLAAAERLGSLMLENPELAEKLLRDESEAVSDAARVAVSHFFFWGVYREKKPARRVAAFRLLRSPTIAAAAESGLVKLLNRECVQEEDRCVSALVEAAADDPETAARLQQLLSSWGADRRRWYDKGIGGPAIAALMYWRQCEQWQAVEQLAVDALADCTEPGKDDQREIAWTQALLEHSRKALGRSSS